MNDNRRRAKNHRRVVDLRVMPAYLEALNEPEVKLVNVHPDNPTKHGLPAVLATILLFDPETGTPICTMDDTLVTVTRTAAPSSVAVPYLARKDSRVLGVVGASGHHVSGKDTKSRKALCMRRGGTTLQNDDSLAEDCR
ncbi:hypothetical protein ACFLUT_02400 [Chloroflexota bacterium]